MIAASRRILLAVLVLGPNLGAGPAAAEEPGRVRLVGALRPVEAPWDALGLIAAPLPPGPAVSNRNGLRAVNAYAPEQHVQHVRLKQMNFTGAQ